MAGKRVTGRDEFGPAARTSSYPSPVVKCGSCGAAIDEPPDVPADTRVACPSCGSHTRVVELSATISSRASFSADLAVERGLNDTRLGVLGFILAVGFGAASLATPAGWEVAVPVGLVATASAAGLIRWRRSRHLLMDAVHRLTGR